MNPRWLFPFAVVGLFAQPSFHRDVLPLLKKNCQGCHSPAMRSSDLDVTTFAAFAKGGKRGPAIPLTLKYLTGETQPRMPLGQPSLAAADIDLYKKWVEAGAKDDSPAETSAVHTPTVYRQPPVLNALRFSPDGNQIAVSGNREILIHSADGNKLLHRLQGRAERILSLAYSSDGSLLVAGGGTPAQFGEVQIWDPRSGKAINAATLTNDTVFGASLAPDSSRIAVGCADNTVHVFDAKSAKELYKIGNHEGWVLGTVFGSDSKRFVSVSRDRAAKLNDAASGAFLENVNLLRGELTAVARHPKKDIVAIGSEDRYAFVYKMDRPRNMKIADDSTLIHKIDRQDGAIATIDWSPDGELFAIAGNSPTVNVYNAETGKLTASCKGHAGGIYALAFTPDGKRLATGGFDGKVRVYNARTCELQHGFIPVPLSGGTQ
ncbi:MAG: WD40 repeat domain-containing protein [Acidobacteria bacterium]|nr:WD40 repeat domain-containing protein [Acidobacteriota bacterium]